MPHIKCPTCATRLYFAQRNVTLTARQRAILAAWGDTKRRAQRDHGLIFPKDMEGFVQWSARTLRREFVVLEQLGEVCRPDGDRSGWALVEQPVIQEVQRLA